MQRLESLLLVLITLLLVLLVDNYQNDDLDDVIQRFEDDVANEEVLKDYYVRGNSVYVKEENRLGRFGQKVSEGIEESANLVVVLFDEIVNDILK